MNRFENWPQKLDEFIESNRNRKFERSVFDCTVFAGLAVKAMTGEDFVKKYIGSYKTKKEGFEILRSEGIVNLTDLVDRCLGQSLDGVGFAGRGDVVLVRHEHEIALAVVDMTGRRAVTPGKDGLFFFDRNPWLKAWKV